MRGERGLSDKLRLVTTLIVCSVVSACAPAEAVPDHDEVERWALGDPILTIGARDDGPAAFSPISDVAFSRAGGVHVLLPQEQAVRWFDREGVFVASIGGPGEGPGEFSRPTSVTFLGDTLLVLDAGARRTTLFHEGRLLRSEPYPDLQGVPTQRSVRVVGLISGSRFLIAAQIGMPLQPAPTDTAFLALLGSSGVERLVDIDADHISGFLTRMSGDQIAAMRPFQQPFSDASIWSVSRSGEEVVVVDRTVGGQPSTFWVTSVNTLTRETVFHVELPYLPIMIPGQLVDSIVGGLTVGGFGAEDVREAAYLPASYPPVSKVFHSADSLIWIAGPVQTGAPVAWQVLTQSGELLAELDTPAGFEVQWSDGSAVWGIEQDEFDVPYLVKRPIQREISSP
jgi:hypothetical protein